MSIKAHQVLESDFLTKNDLSGNASDVIGGDGVVRGANLEPLETIDFVDLLNNNAIHGTWTQNIPTVGTIAEDGSKLSISHTGGTTLSWHSSNTDSPNVYIDIEPFDFVAMVHVDILSNVDQGGGIVHYLSGDKTSYHRWLLEFSGGVYRVDSMQNSIDQTYFTIGQDNCWLAIMRRGNRLSYYFSNNSINDKPASVNDMTLHKTVDLAFEYTPNRIALLSATWAGTPNAVDSHFKQFSIKYETVSSRLRGFVGQGSDFHDNLNNSLIHDLWTKDIPDVADPDPTITEDGSKLAMTRAGPIELEWFGATHTAPSINIPVEPYDFTAMVHVSNLADANINTGGIIIHTDGNKQSFFRIDIRAMGSDQYDIRAGKGPNIDLALVTDIGQNSVWLVLARRGFEMMGGYSLNAADNKPGFNDVIITETEACSVLDSYNNNLIALFAMSVGGNPGIDTHFKNFSLVYNNINLYQNDSYLVEEWFELDGTEAPDSTKTFYLTQTPGGAGQAKTPCGYHIFVFRNGQKIGYTGTLADRLHFTYSPSQNSVSIWASGSVEEIEVQMIEAVAGAGVASTSWVEDTVLYSNNADSATHHALGRFTNGVKFRCLKACRIVGLKYYVGEDDSGLTYKVSLWRVSDTTRVAEVNLAGPSAAGVIEARFDAPYEISGSEIGAQFMATLYWGDASGWRVESGAKTVLDGPQVIGEVYAVDQFPSHYISGDAYPTSWWGTGYYKIDPIIEYDKSIVVDNVSLELESQGYTVEDNFSDSVLHSRWTKFEPGSTTVVEGSDGLVITVPASAGVTPYVEMDLPAEMSSRNWIAQCHLYATYTALNAIAIALLIRGQGGGVEKYLSGYAALGSSKVIAMGDSAGSVTTAESGADDIWVRLRRFGDEIRFDYYPAAHTIDPDAGGYWREWDSSKTWYVTPKSGTFNYPVLYEKLRIYGSHWDDQPDFVLTVRHFKLRIF